MSPKNEFFYSFTKYIKSTVGSSHKSFCSCIRQQQRQASASNPGMPRLASRNVTEQETRVTSALPFSAFGTREASPRLLDFDVFFSMNLGDLLP
jgi:hypothetical protein